ncbi:3-ketoacyl-ACP reductase [Gluconacetobacter azotocaptans]|uniref:3-ketoacyl-ACP reductase n=1 Tax=Gluconacetobacter azotocaptans TaxID=142834 RepID=A0A7W4JPZ7_9PROT|nr:3-ketoacyl-ACP reductase [Gluconacetobacter azotocaptans]MBB2188800.1 3-ketoacyl-ACP reductase [Gluconacetobacter azotocaptans]GBQ31078.1 3-ketoacyl-ACP reductase [Gluconacetobacter azotocaptans DSM 13594]
MRQVALVTGASRGIGLAAAEALAQDGFAIALNGLFDDAELHEAVRRVKAHGVPVMAAPFDVSDTTLAAGWLARIEETLGPLTTLVNNAGVGVLQRGDLLDVTEESWDRCLTVNAKALFFLSQAFTRRLLSRTRPETLFHSIVNVTSSNARAVAVQRSEYCASKAAAAMVSMAFAVRLGPENIAVYDVQPGLIATDMTAPVIEMYRKRAADGLTLMPRVGEPADMGGIIATLASGKLPYTTGQVISADAGLLVPRF